MSRPSSDVELVLFYGPPFIGKTLYYFEHYSKTHSRISASEIFKEDKCSNLRLVILKAIEILVQGKNVVIDDENWYIATRRSYTSLVRKKVPNCSFIIVDFKPDSLSGYQQCLWAREWALVNQTVAENKDYNLSFLSESDEKLDCWFAKTRSDLNPPELPTTAEGFSIVTVKSQLMCETSCKFHLPALFIQWQSLLVDVQNEKLGYKPTATDVINKWSDKNPSGRIIIIGPKRKNGKEIIEEQMKTSLLQLASQLISPLYFAFIDEKHQMDHYSRLPQPGVLAFLQKLHTIDLYHKGTMYIYSSDEHYRGASSTGIRTVKAEKLFKYPHLISSVYSGEATSLTLPFLKNILQVNCATPNNQEKPVSEDQIPFFSRARESSLPLAWKYCFGKVNGVCFKDRAALERYQTQYKLAAQPAQPSGKSKPKTCRTKYVPLPKQSSKSSSSSLSRNQSVDVRACVGNIDLREVAETPGRYQGGFQCRDNVFDMNVEVLERRVKVTCKCSGSSKDPYNVQVTLSDSTGLLEASCSCPDLAGKTGRCKHVIGLLLNYKKRQELFLSHHDPQKSGPSKTPRGNDDKNLSKKRGVETLYCMSQEELLETAKEILQKHEEKSTQEQPLTQKLDDGSGNGDRLEDQREKRSNEQQRGDILEELLFSTIKESKKTAKKLCPERIPSFVEDTPTDKLPSFDQECHSVTTAIIPDSLVPESISLIPETIRTVSSSSTHSSCEESVKERQKENDESFEAFLDEMI